MLTPNELILTFGGCYLCATFGKNRSRNATVRVQADRQTDGHMHRQRQTQSIICPMLYAIAMGQTIMITQHTFNSHSSRTIRVSWYQKKNTHSLTPYPSSSRHYTTPLINFLCLQA